MKSPFASDHAIAALAALEQRPDGLTLADLSRAVGASLSATQTAVRILADSGLATGDAESRPQYAITAAAAGPARQLVSAALGLGQRGVLDAGLRASPGVELAARDATGLLVVTPFDVTLAAEAALADLIARAAIPAEIHGHDAVRGDTALLARLRARAIAATLVIGNLDRSLPDPDGQTTRSALLLRYLHPNLGRVSSAAAARIARDFGLKQVRVVGSAMRDDFRPGSEVEVVVARRDGEPLGNVRPALRRQLEALFDHDVRLIDPTAAPTSAAEAQGPGVTLYGPKDGVPGMFDPQIMEFFGAVPQIGVDEAWEGVANADRVPPTFRTNEPDNGWSHISSLGQLRTAVRHIYAIRLAGRDPDRYRQITRSGLRWAIDGLNDRHFAEYLAWLDMLEEKYPGKLDQIVAAYRQNSPNHTAYVVTFDELLRAYEENAARLANAEV